MSKRISQKKFDVAKQNDLLIQLYGSLYSPKFRLCLSSYIRKKYYIIRREYFQQEYSDLSTNMRHYGNMRFAQLTIFIAITGALLKFRFESNSSLPCVIKQLVALGGLIISVVFLIMEISSSYLWAHFARRAAELETRLGYYQYSTLLGAPKFNVRPSTWAIGILFLFVLFFWAVVIFYM